jgi:membrane protein
LGGQKTGKFGKSLLRFLKALLLELWTDTKHLIPAGRLFYDSRGFDHAAAISFYFILSLAPFLVLLVSAVGYLAANLGQDPAALNQFIDKLSASVRTYIPVESETVRGIVDYLISRKVSFGIAGTAVLVLGASAVFGALENATADIFRDGRRRTYIMSRLIFTVGIATAGLLGFMLYNAVTLVQSFLDARIGSSFIEGLLSTSAFKFLFEWIPVPIGFLIVLYGTGIARPRFVDALRGAALYFLLWTVVREAYGHYVTQVANYNLLYGSLATPILLVLWLFYSALLLIFCLCFTAVTKKPESRRE